LPNIWIFNQYKEAHESEADAIRRAKVWVNFIPSELLVEFCFWIIVPFALFCPLGFVMFIIGMLFYIIGIPWVIALFDAITIIGFYGFWTIGFVLDIYWGAGIAEIY